MNGWSHPAFERVARLVSVQTGLTFATHRARDAEQCIRRAMQRAQVSDVSRYLALVDSRLLPLDDLVGELTVGETYFFRDPQHFDFIRREVLPDVHRRRGPAHGVRAWSAGCATGEEAYSLAILLEDSGVPGHIVATDLSPAAIARAREGTYRPWSLRGTAADVLQRSFEPAATRWRIADRYRARVTLAVHNLVESVYPFMPLGLCDMDVILCRNVFIYLDGESVGRVARGLADSLADGGWLITGPSDPPLDGITSLQTVIADCGLVYRKRDSGHVQTNTTVESAAPPDAHSGVMPLPPVGVRPPAAAEPSASRVREAFACGQYEYVLRVTEDVRTESTAVLRVRASANALGPGEALTEVARRIEQYPLSAELHLLRALLLIDLKRDADAIEALRRVLYLDRTLIIASVLLASALGRQRRLADARRAYRNARDLAKARPADEALALGDGARAGTIAELADSEIVRLDRELRS
jgi:chemotaxis protein methyltransferase CheR